MNPSVVTSGWKDVCSSKPAVVSIGGRNGAKFALRGNSGSEVKGFWGFLNDGMRPRGRCLGFFSV